MTVILSKIPKEAVYLCAKQLTNFGCEVLFDTEFEDYLAGDVNSISGRIKFTWQREELTVNVVKNMGHFPELLLLGGIKQLVDEACEDVRNDKLPKKS